MENHETRHGILALIDIVNFTGQANNLAEKYAAAGELMVTRELYQGIKSIKRKRKKKTGRG